jgi:lactoylglutathione lyase
MGGKFNAVGLTASLTVKDLETSKKWYRDVVGFEIDREIEREGKVVAVAVRAGDVRLMLNQDNGARGLDRVKGEGFSLMIMTNDVDDVANQIKANGGTLAMEPTDMPWGARVFRIEDPDGYRFAVSTPR